MFSFGTDGGVTFGVLGLAGTVEVDGTKVQGLGGGVGCFPLDTGGGLALVMGFWRFQEAYLFVELGFQVYWRSSVGWR